MKEVLGAIIYRECMVSIFRIYFSVCTFETTIFGKKKKKKKKNHQVTLTAAAGGRNERKKKKKTIRKKQDTRVYIHISSSLHTKRSRTHDQAGK